MQHPTSRAPVRLPAQVFHSSAKSQVARLRRWMWLAVAVPLALSLPTLGAGRTWLISAASTLGICLLVHWVLTRQLRPGQPIVVLDDEGIQSPQFKPAPQRYRWDEVLDVTPLIVQGYPVLRLQLTSTTDRPDRRAFWSGFNPARPTLALNVLCAEDQLRLLEALRSRIARAEDRSPGAPLPQRSALHDAHRFEADLKARTPVPWACHVFAALNIVVWGITLSLGADPISPSAQQLLAWGGNAASEVQRGAWWRLLSATFLHSGALHLTLNMVGLWAIGTTVERLFGHRLFALVYLASALVGSGFSLHFAAQKAVSVGASGAVFGLAGALLTVVIRHRHALPPLFGARNRNSMLFFIAYSLYQGFTKPGVDNAAHIGGLLAGAALAWTLPERLTADSARKPVMRALLGGSLATAVVCTLLVISAPPAQRDVRALFEGESHFVAGMRELQGSIVALQRDQQALQARRTTPGQLEQRIREVHVPAMRRAFNELQQARLAPDDPRQPVIEPARALATLTVRRLAPATPLGPLERQALDEELKDAADRLNAAMRALPRESGGKADKPGPQPSSIDRQSILSATPVTRKVSTFFTPTPGSPL